MAAATDKVFDVQQAYEKYFMAVYTGDDTPAIPDLGAAETLGKDLTAQHDAAIKIPDCEKGIDAINKINDALKIASYLLATDHALGYAQCLKTSK